MKLPPIRRADPGPAVGMASSDELRALSVLNRPVKTGPRRRCGTCGLVFPSEEVRPEVNEDGRTVGWTCFGCE